MGISNRGRGTGGVRLSSLRSQIPADFSPRPEGARPALSPGKLALCGEVRAPRVPASPAPRPAPPRPRPTPPLRRQAASARSRSPEPRSPSLSPSSLGRFSRRRASAAGSARPPPPIPQDLRWGRGGSEGRGWRGGGVPGAGPETRSQSAAAAQKRKEGGAELFGHQRPRPRPLPAEAQPPGRADS